MKRTPEPRVETHRTVRRGERTIEVRVITYPVGKRRGVTAWRSSRFGRVWL